jgi:hypothetical protein
MPLREKKLRILLAEGDSGKFATSLRALYPEEQGKLELTVVSGISSLLATVEVVNPEKQLQSGEARENYREHAARPGARCYSEFQGGFQ